MVSPTIIPSLSLRRGHASIISNLQDMLQEGKATLQKKYFKCVFIKFLPLTHPLFDKAPL